MKQNVELLQDEFVDYAGKKHIFIVAAVRTTVAGSNVSLVKANELEAELIGEASEIVTLGVSICNPADKFVEKAGVMRAIHWAEEDPEFTYCCLNPEGFDVEEIRSFLKKAARVIKKDRDRFIPGYSDMEARYKKNKAMEEIGKNLNEVERIVVEKSEADPKFLTKIQTYLEWKKNQKKGKCQKRGE